MGGGEAGGEASGVLPTAGAFEETKFKLLHPVISNQLRGEVFQFSEGVGEHTQVRITHGRFGALKVLAKFREQTHIIIYNTARENGRGGSKIRHKALSSSYLQNRNFIFFVFDQPIRQGWRGAG